MTDRQCSSCGGFCKKSGCERENVSVCYWTRVSGSQYTYRKSCGGNVILFYGRPSEHTCVCGKLASEGME